MPPYMGMARMSRLWESDTDTQRCWSTSHQLLIQMSHIGLFLEMSAGHLRVQRHRDAWIWPVSTISTIQFGRKRMKTKLNKSKLGFFTLHLVWLTRVKIRKSISSENFESVSCYTHTHTHEALCKPAQTDCLYVFCHVLFCLGLCSQTAVISLIQSKPGCAVGAVITPRYWLKGLEPFPAFDLHAWLQRACGAVEACPRWFITGINGSAWMNLTVGSGRPRVCWGPGGGCECTDLADSGAANTTQCFNFISA